MKWLMIFFHSTLNFDYQIFFELVGRLNLKPFLQVFAKLTVIASEPRNMGYMIRLGIWGPGAKFKSGEFHFEKTKILN
jgi:hypothetical protein